MVLLTNDGTLPLVSSGGTSPSSLAVIGPNADRAQIMGGGSSAVSPQHRTTPLNALRQRFPDTEIRYEPGCVIDRKTPALDASQLITPDGQPGLALTFYAGTDGFDGDPIGHGVSESSRLLYLGTPADGVPASGWSLRAQGSFVPALTGTYEVTLNQVGTARVFLDGVLIVDGTGAQVGGGEDFFGIAGPPITTTTELTAGAPIELTIEFATGELPLHGVHVGIGPAPSDDLIERAVAAATDADAAIVIVGTTDEWESEGFDRASMQLPGAQDELIRRVCAANPRTVVVLNCGAPVTMPWRDDPAAILAIWFGGQEMAGALAEVLAGDAEPGGRLPTTLPAQIEHTPAFGNFPGEDSQVRYGEGLLIGYRWYDTRLIPVLFPFGHGLSYTSFQLGTPRLARTEWQPGQTLTITVPVRNTGTRRGSEVVQLYVEPISPSAFRPRRELKAFGKVTLEPGAAAQVVLELSERAFAHWDNGNPEHEHLAARMADAGAFAVAGETKEPGWRVDPGEYVLHIGRSLADIAHQISVEVPG
jgi:beta-glucosidase